MSINRSNLPPPDRITMSSGQLDKLILRPTERWEQSSGHMTREYQSKADELPRRISTVSSDILLTIEDQETSEQWKCILIDDQSHLHCESGDSRNCQVELLRPHADTVDSNSFDIHSVDDVNVTSNVFAISKQAELYDDNTWKPISMSMRTSDDKEICTNATGWWDPKHSVMYDTTNKDFRPDRYEIGSKSINKRKNGEIVHKGVVVSQVDASVVVEGRAAAICD